MSQTKAQLIDNLVSPITGALGSAAAPTFSFTADPNTGLYSPGADQLAISTGGTDRLFIDSSGRLLVGTSTARSNFFGTTLSSLTQTEGTGDSTARGALSVINNDVSNNPPYVLLGRSGAATLGSNAAVVSGSRLGTLTFHGADGTSFIEAATVAGEVDGTPGTNDMPGRLVFSTTADDAASPTERLRITSTGAVGIGNSGPDERLVVAGAIRSTSNATNWASSDGALVDYYAGEMRLVAARSGANSSTMSFTTYNSGTAATRMFIDSSGRCGIGTTSPAFSLDIVGDLRVTNSAGSAITVNRTSNPGSVAWQHSGTETGQIQAVSGGGLNFYIGSTPSLKATIDSSGRLLVGTSSWSSSDKLVVRGNTSGDDEARFSLVRGTVPAADQNIGVLHFQQGNANEGARITALRDGGTWTAGSSHPTRLVFSTTADGSASPTERMRISNSGILYNVSTANGFIVSSTVTAGTGNELIEGKHSGTAGTAGSGTTSFRVYTNGNVQNTNNSYGAISDAKLKENIVDAGSQWSDLKSLQVRKYNLKAETNQQTHTQIGLVAQEVELISPGLVSESPDRDEEGNDLGTVTKSVNYSVLYMKAVKALQEAMERIEALETKVAALESA